MILAEISNTAHLVAEATLLVDLLLRLGLSTRIIMCRKQVGTTFAWLMVVLAVPFLGALIYLMFGELRLGSRRAKYAREIHGPFQQWVADLEGRIDIDWTSRGLQCEPLARLCRNVFGLPAKPGNKLQLLPDWEAVFRALIADIDAARRTCHLEFYIWNAGGLAGDVAAALLRAAARGVKCRVLLDDVGSRQFLRSEQAKRLRAAGIRVHGALPVGLLRMLFVRFDLRLHRKIVVIDGEIGYTGSLNLVDPRFFKQDAGVGQWVDAMVRMEGPAVEALAVTFLEDWQLETSEGLDELRRWGDVHALSDRGESVVQVIPSGPVFEERAVQDVVLMAIYAARRELVLTSPYFVPDEVLATALASAARRGVSVTLIVPARVDSLLVRFASQAFQGDLLESGVNIALFDAGLLHTKSISVDGEFCLFGSLNLDPRSLHLNFEITLGVYDAVFTRELRALQQGYIDQSQRMELAQWRSRSAATRFTENVLRLLGPLL